jgi:hypothetical protein
VVDHREDGRPSQGGRNQALRRQPGPKCVKLDVGADLGELLRGKLERQWSPQQVMAFLRAARARESRR